MIKIEHPKLNEIAQKHYEACLDFIEPRLSFYIDFFDSLGNGNNLALKAGETLPSKFNLKDVTFYSLVNSFLIKAKRRKDNHWNVNINEIKTAICTSDKHIIYDYFKHRSLFKELHNYFYDVKNHLPSLLKGEPSKLVTFTNERIKGLKKECIEKVFSYERLTGDGFICRDGSIWNNYTLAGSLEIIVCPYCNRNWINTVKDGIFIDKKGNKRKKVTSPQLDHFFSKGDFPILRLSFFNLIPSCETCNARLKKQIEFEFDKNLHPYREEYGGECCFEVMPQNYNASIGKNLDYKVSLNTDLCTDKDKISRVQENHKIFEIDRIYEDHLDLVAELYRKKSISGNKYLDIIKSQFPSAGLTTNELYRLAFGNYIAEPDFKKRPFAKLTKDVAKQLGLI